MARSLENTSHPASATGTYLLFLKAARAIEIQVGSLGLLSVEPGTYAYVGSAFGPGGLRARLAHHLKGPRQPHWHVDFLRQVADPCEIWLTEDAIPREHEWAAVMGAMPAVSIPSPRFGASDCHCPAHLFFFTGFPPYDTFIQALKVRLPAHAPVRRLRVGGG